MSRLGQQDLLSRQGAGFVSACKFAGERKRISNGAIARF
jgi:hypothetical protein